MADLYHLLHCYQHVLQKSFLFLHWCVAFLLAYCLSHCNIVSCWNITVWLFWDCFTDSNLLSEMPNFDTGRFKPYSFFSKLFCFVGSLCQRKKRMLPKVSFPRWIQLFHLEGPCDGYPYGRNIAGLHLGCRTSSQETRKRSKRLQLLHCSAWRRIFALLHTRKLLLSRKTWKWSSRRKNLRWLKRSIWIYSCLYVSDFYSTNLLKRSTVPVGNIFPRVRM